MRYMAMDDIEVDWTNREHVVICKLRIRLVVM